MPVVKIIELLGSSPDGWNEAVQKAVTEQPKRSKTSKSVHVKQCTAKVEDNKVVQYNTKDKIAFIVKR